MRDKKNPKDVCGEATDKHLLILHFIVILALLLLRVPSIDITLENEYLKKKRKKKSLLCDFNATCFLIFLFQVGL